MKIILLMLSLLVSSNAQDGIRVLFIRGKAWNEMGEMSRLYYLAGFFDSLAFNKMIFDGYKISSKPSFDEYDLGVTELYKDFRNSRIEAPYALIIVSMQMTGESAETVEKTLEAFRKRSTNR